MMRRTTNRRTSPKKVIMFKMKVKGKRKWKRSKRDFGKQTHSFKLTHLLKTKRAKYSCLNYKIQENLKKLLFGRVKPGQGDREKRERT